MTDQAVQPEATTKAGQAMEAWLREPENYEWGRKVTNAILAIEAEARAASQERPQPDYRPEFPNECGWVGALGWADYETPNGRPCTLPDDHEGPHQRNPVGASQERPRPDTDGALRAALVRLIAAQDVNASVGERMAATTAARAALAGEEQWNNESPESGATATGSSATSAPFATRSGDEPTDCPRCHHESRWHRSGGCVATYRTVDGETPCRCRDQESEVGE
jgi:hypothetical protein